MPVLEPEIWYGQVPIKQEEIFRNLPLKASGSVHTVSAKSIEALHNRTSFITLKMFLTENLNVSTKAMKETRRIEDDGMCTTMELDWLTATSVTQLQEAVVNYGVCLQALWPYDTTAWAFMRLMTKYRWLSNVDQTAVKIKIIVNVFNRIVQKNGSNAANEGHPMYFSDMEELLKDSLSRNGLRNDIPLANKKQEPGGFSQQASRFKEFKPAGQRFAGQVQKPPPPLLAGNKLCYGYNSDDGRNCMNAPSGQDKNGAGGGCKNARQTYFAHACSMWMLNRNRYCLGRHRLCQHK